MAIKNGDKRVTKKYEEQKALVIEYLQKNHIAKSEEFIDVLGVKISRVKTILLQMAAENVIVAEGENRNRHYKLNNLNEK